MVSKDRSLRLPQKASCCRAQNSIFRPLGSPHGQKSKSDLLGIWREVLGIDAVGAVDDFFELGGDSFAATALAAEIEAAFDLRFPPSEIINLSTVARQAETIAAQTAGLTQTLPAHLILSRAGGSQPPVFIVHGGLGLFSLNRNSSMRSVEIGRSICSRPPD